MLCLVSMLSELGMNTGGNQIGKEDEVEFNYALPMAYMAKEKTKLTMLAIACYKVWNTYYISFSDAEGSMEFGDPLHDTNVFVCLRDIHNHWRTEDEAGTKGKVLECDFQLSGGICKLLHTRPEPCKMHF